MKKITSVILLVASLFTLSSLAQEKAKIATYNLLQYKSSNSRTDYFKLIIKHISPDILVVNEIADKDAVEYFAKNVLGNKFVAGKFVQNSSAHPYHDISNAIFLRDSLFEFISNKAITVTPQIGPRDLNQFTIRHKITGDTLIIYSVHLKASSGSKNEKKRETTIFQLRKYTDKLPKRSNFIICGDFNVYKSSEPCLEVLKNKDSGTGYFIDPLNSEGNWHANSAFSQIHTQSPRTKKFGGGANGGLDDRFDLIFISEEVKQKKGIDYVEGSYKTYGNDGNHFDIAINVFPNTSASEEVIEAFHSASDHLPVSIDLTFEGSVPVENNLNNPITEYVLKQNYPNPFNPETTFEFIMPQKESVELSIYNILGKKIETLFNGTATKGLNIIKFSRKNISSGVYIYTLKTKNKIISKKFLLLK